MFLTDIDYKSHHMAKNLNILTLDDDVTVRNFAEAAAEEEMRSYLATRFKVSDIFIDIAAWDSNKTYSVNDHVIHTDKIFYAATGCTNQNPTTATTCWTEGDQRNPLIVMRMIDIAVYHMFAKIPNRQTPEDVGLRYEEAINWLKGIAKGHFTPSLPIKETSASNPSEMLYGSETPINWN